MVKVCIVQRRLTHYRVPLFGALRELLAQRGIRLELVVGQGTPAEEKKQDAGELPWAQTSPTRYLLGDRLCWQPLRNHVAGAELVIVTQENKLLQNHLLMALPRRFKLAFWGHGANLQSDRPEGVKERFKRWTTRKVDWWFAYTDMSAALVRAAGFPDTRITVLNNAVDTSELRRQHRSVGPDEARALRDTLGFGDGPVGIFVGSLYADKRLDFIFSAAEQIRRAVPDFQLLVVGDGPERDAVRAWCDARTWASWTGARFGREKAACLKLSDIMLNPAALGLGILDAFACGVPIVTVDSGKHGPEAAYLIPGTNGLMTIDDLDTYVHACVSLLSNPVRLDALREGCAASAEEYTIEHMAQRFADGIERCLNAPRYSGRGV
ncbi:MAG: glycosyltransferase family 4 protein [Pseudomonadota bacterium]|jgi:glycosyltransferase involved in cell wall biosynthesis